MIYFLAVRFFFLLATCAFLAESAPVQESNSRQPRQKGCYYLSDHYDNGERIDTNEPCLNCTCLNSMLMCYLRICPFVKPVGEECIIEREEGDCCPKIWCPEVIKDKENTPKPSEKRKQQPGCYLNDQYYPDGAMLPHDPKRPCEVCYCIRNSTACVMQECELKVDGCFPMYKEGQCCPCRYNCTYEEATPTPPGVTLMELAEGCTLPDGSFVEDGEAVNSTNPCEHCYCMRNEVVCAIQECQAPGDNCRPVPPKSDQCCPDRYECLVNTISPNSFEKPISLQFSTVFTTSFGTTTTSPDLGTIKGKINDGSKVKGASKKEVVDEIPSPVYIPPQQTKSSETSKENFSTVPSISQKSSASSELHIQEGVTSISTLIDSSSIASTGSEAEVEEKAKSITVTSAESLLSDKFTATSSEKILTEVSETTFSSHSDEKSFELSSTYHEASTTSSPTQQSQQTAIQAEVINAEEHYKKVTVQEETRKPTEYSQKTTIQGEISSTTEYSEKSTTQEYTSSTEYSHEITTHDEIKSSTEYPSSSTIQAETSIPTEQSPQTTAQTEISHPTEISKETTSETQPPRKSYGVKGSSFSHKSSSTHTPSAAPENVELSTESFTSEKTSSPSESDKSHSSATVQTEISHPTEISKETTSETQPPRKSYGVKGSSFSHKSSSTHTPSAAPENVELSTESFTSEKTSSPSESDKSHSSATVQTEISHPTEISKETTSETQPPRKSYGVKGSSFSHKSSSTHTPSAAPENVELSTESFTSEKTSSPSESDRSHSSANTTQTQKEKADSVKESTFSPPNIIRVKGRRPSTPSEEPEKASSTEPTTASQEYNFKESETDDSKIKQPTGVKSSQKKGHIKGKRPQIKEKPLLPVGVIPGEKKQTASTTALPSIKGRPSVMSIPGEGSCHVGKVSYKHGQAVPSSDVCKMSCQCSTGKIYCVEIVCEALQHENYGECQLVRNQSQCCPHYECGTSITKPAEYLDITEFTSVDGVFVSSTTVQRTGTSTTESSSVFPVSSTESTVVTDHGSETHATSEEPSDFSITKETPSSPSSSTKSPFSHSSTEISHISNEVEVSTIGDYTDFSDHQKVSIHEDEYQTEKRHPQEEIGSTYGSTKLFSVAEISEETATASVSYDSTVKDTRYTTQETSTTEKESAEFISIEVSTESPVTENRDDVSFDASKRPSTTLHSTSTTEEIPKTTFEDSTVEKITDISNTLKTSSFPSITSEEQTETPEEGTHTVTDQKSSPPSKVTDTSEVVTERYSHSDSEGVTENVHHSEAAGETSTYSSVTSTKVSLRPEEVDKFEAIVTDKDIGTTIEYETSSDKVETFFVTTIKSFETSKTSEDSENLISPKTTIISTPEESSVMPPPEETNHGAESSFETDPSSQEKFTFTSIQTGDPSTQTPFADLSSTEKSHPTVVDLSSIEKHQPSIVETVVYEDEDAELSSSTVIVPSSESQSTEYIPKTVITSNVPTEGLGDISGTTVSKVETEESHMTEAITIVSEADSTVLLESDLQSDLHTQHSSSEKDITESQTTSPHSLQTTVQQDGISTDSVHTSTGKDIVHLTDVFTADAEHLTTLKEHISDTTVRTTEQSHATERTTEQSHATERTTEQSHATERTTEQSHATERTTEQSHATERTTEQSHATERTTEQDHITERTTEQIHASERTTEQSHATERTTEQSHATERTTEQSHATERTTEQSHATEMTTEQSHATERTTERSHATERTTEQDHITERTTEQGHITERTTEPSHSVKSTDIQGSTETPTTIQKDTEEHEEPKTASGISEEDEVTFTTKKEEEKTTFHVFKGTTTDSVDIRTSSSEHTQGTSTVTSVKDDFSRFGTSTVTPVIDDFSTVGLATIKAEEGFPVDIIDADSSDDSIKFTETKSATVSSTESTEAPLKHQSDAESHISHETELTTPSSKPEGSSIAFSVGTTVFEETISEHETGAETDSTYEVDSTSLYPNAAESSSTFEDSSHFEEATATHEVDAVSDNSQHEQFTSPVSESGYSTELQTEFSFHDATEAPKTISPISFVAADGKTTPKSEESTKESLKGEFSGVSLDSKATDGEIIESGFSTAHAEEIRSSSVSGISSTQTPQELDYDTKSSTPVSVSVSEESFTSVRGTFTTEGEKPLPSEEILNPAYEDADNEISNDYVTEFFDSDYGNLEDKGIFSKKKPGPDTAEEAIKPEKHTTESYVEIIKPEQHTTESHIEAIESEQQTTESHAESIKPEQQHTTKSQDEVTIPDKHPHIVAKESETTTKLHIEDIEPEQHTTESYAESIKPEQQHTTGSHIEAIASEQQHTTESHVKSIKPEQQHTTESHAESISPEQQHTTESHAESINPEQQYTTVSNADVFQTKKSTHIEGIEPEQHTSEPHAETIKPDQFTTQSSFKVSTSENETSKPHEETVKIEEIFTQTPESIVEEITSHGITEESEKSIVDLSETHKSQDHAEEFETITFTSSTTSSSDHQTSTEELTSSPSSTERSTFISDSITTVQSGKSTPAEISHSSVSLVIETSDVSISEHDSSSTEKPETVESIGSHKEEFKPFSVESTSLPIMIIDGASTQDEKTVQTESSSLPTVLSHEEVRTTQEPHQSSTYQTKVYETIPDEGSTSDIDEEATKDAHEGVPVTESIEYNSETNEKTITLSTASHHETESANAIADDSKVPSGFGISTSEPENLILKEVTGLNAQEENEFSSSTVKDIISTQPTTEYASFSVSPTQLSTVHDKIEDSKRTEAIVMVTEADHHTEDSSHAQDFDSKHTSSEDIEDDSIHTRVFTTHESTQEEKETTTIRFESTEKPTTLQKASSTVSERATTVQPDVSKTFASTSAVDYLTSTKIPEHSTHVTAEFDHSSPVVDHSEDEETIESFTDPPKQTEKPESHIKLSHTQRPSVSVEDAAPTDEPQTPTITEKFFEEKVESSITTVAASEESDGSFDASKATEVTSDSEKLDTHTIILSHSTIVPTIIHSGTSTLPPKSVVTQTVQTPVLLETTQITMKEDSPTEHEATDKTKDEEAEPLTHPTEKDTFTVSRTTTSSDIHTSDINEPSNLLTVKPMEDESNMIEDTEKFTEHEEAYTESTTVSKFSETTTASEEHSIVFANTPESVSPEESYDHSILLNATEMISTEIDIEFKEHEKTSVTISAQTGEILASTSSDRSKDVSEVTSIENKSKTTLVSEFSSSTDSSTEAKKAETSSIRVEEGPISTEYSELQKYTTSAPEILKLDGSKPTGIASETSVGYFSTEDSSLLPKIKVTSEEASTHSATFDDSSTIQEAQTEKTELTTKKYSEHVTSSSFIHQVEDETTYDSSNEQSELDLETEFQTSPKSVDDENESAESGLKQSTSFIEQSEETDESFGDHGEYTSTLKVVSENEPNDSSVFVPSTTISVRDEPFHSAFTTVYDLISTPKPLKLDVNTESQHSTNEYLPADAQTAENLHETDKYLDISTTKEEKPSTLPVPEIEEEAVKDSIIKQVTEKHEVSESTDYEGLDAGSTIYANKELTTTTFDDVAVKTTTSKQLSSDILPKDSITDHDKIPYSSTFSPETTSDIQQDSEAGLNDSDSKADAIHSTTIKHPQEAEDINLITEEAQEIFGSTKMHSVNDTKGVSLPEILLTDSDIINEFTSPSDSKHSSENIADLTHTSLTHTTDQILTQDHGFHKQTYTPEVLDEGLEENIKEFFSITSTIKSFETTSPDDFTTKSTVNLSSLPEIPSDITETSSDKHEADADSLSVTKESTKGSDTSILTTLSSFIPENLIDSSIIPSQQGNLPTVDADTTYLNQDIVDKKPFASSSTTVTGVNKLDDSQSILTHTVNAFEIELVNQTMKVDSQKETSPSIENKDTVTSDSKVTTISDKSGFETSSSSSVSPSQDYGFHKEVYNPPKHEESTQFVQKYDTTKLPISSTFMDESVTPKSIPSDSTLVSIKDAQTDQEVTVDKKSTTDFAVTSIKESTDAQTDVPTEELTDKVAETSSDDTKIHVTSSDHTSFAFSTSDVTSTFLTGSVPGAHLLDEDEIKQKSPLQTETTISSSTFFTTEYAKSSVEDQKVTEQTQEEKLTETPNFDTSSASSIQTISNEETKKEDEFETDNALESRRTSKKPTDYDYLYTTYISHTSSSAEFSKDSDSFPTEKFEIADVTKENFNLEEQHSTLHSEDSDVLTTSSDNADSANISEESLIQSNLTTDYEPKLPTNITTTDQVSDLDTSELSVKKTVQVLEVSSTTDKNAFDDKEHSTKYEIPSKTVTFLPKLTDIVSTHVTEIFDYSTDSPQDYTKAVDVISTHDGSDLHTEFSFNDGVSEHYNTDKIDGSEEFISTKSPSTSIVDKFSTFSGNQNESFTKPVHDATISYDIKNEEGKFSDISGAHTSSSTSVTIETLRVSSHDTSSTYIPTSTPSETSSYVFESSPGQETQPEGVEKVYDIESFTIKQSVSNESTTKIATDSTFIASDSWNLSGDQDRIVTIKSSVSDDKSTVTDPHSTFSSDLASTTTEHYVGSSTTHPQTSTSWDFNTGETSSTAGSSRSQEGVTSSADDASSSITHGEMLETLASFFPHSSPPSILFESHKSSSFSSSSTTASTSHKHTTAKPTDESSHHFPEDGYCLYENEVYNSAEQIPRKDPCEFCFCFRGDIICLQQSCPPPIRGCYATPINGFCCPRFHCPVQEMHFNLSTTTTTTPDPRMGKYLPPADQSTGCEIEGNVYRVHQVVRPSSGPCMLCRCEMGGIMKCDPRDCQPQAPLLLRLNREFFKKR